MSKKITIFKTIKDINNPFHRDVFLVLERIKNGDSKELVESIRNEKVKSQRNELKKLLPSICFSGVFTRRSDDAIIEHSGIICLDFDGYDTNADLLKDKEVFKKDSFVYSVFVSPSGNGLKVLVKVPCDIDNHKDYFKALEQHFKSPYFDKTCSNISRVCYESYDPLIYVNVDSVVWDRIIQPKPKEIILNRQSSNVSITDENKVADILVKWWVKNYPMIEGQRNHNAYVLAMAFNDYGIDKSLAEYVLHQYQSPDFSVEEINQTIDSAYINTQNFGTKYYEDEDVTSDESIDIEVLKRTHKGYEQNTFIQNLLTKVAYPFEVEDVKRVISMYHLGTVKSATTFPFIDINNNIKAIQIKQFDKTKDSDLPECVKAESKVSCLFGEHLLNKYPYNPIALVESPKTAIYGTLYFGLPESSEDLIWVSVYSLDGLKLNRYQSLKDRSVCLFPDSSKGKDFADYLIKQDWRLYRNQGLKEIKPTIQYNEIKPNTTYHIDLIHNAEDLIKEKKITVAHPYKDLVYLTKSCPF